jgi:hypothetical protein
LAVFFLNPASVFARCAKFLVIVALVLTTGLHWAALQTLAWTTMLANHLCTQSVSEAVSETFDGKHPCCLCKAIAAGKKSEKKSESISPTLKMEYPPTPDKFVLIPPEPVSAFSLADFPADLFSHPPPVPPPRGFFV